MWIIASGVGAIVPGLPGVGLRAVARVRVVAVIAGTGIVVVIPTVGIAAVIPVVVEGKEGITITPPKKRWEGASETEHGAEMPKAMVGPAAIIGIGYLWMYNSASKQQCC
jgi:hypothetical protein